MVSPTQLCWSYHSSPPRQRYMPRGLSHKVQSWRPSCWGTWNPVITELSTMPAGRYDFCPFVQGWWWVSCSYHRLLCKADITSPCATLVRCCTLRYAPIDLIWLVVVLNFPDVLGQLSFPSATLCTEWVGVTIEARFEGAVCQTLVVFVRLLWHWDCGLVHDAFGQAVSTKGAFAGLSAIACAWCLGGGGGGGGGDWISHGCRVEFRLACGTASNVQLVGQALHPGNPFASRGSPPWLLDHSP